MNMTANTACARPGPRRSSLRLFLVLLAALQLAACSSGPVRSPIAQDPTIQAAREAILALQTSWSFEGRLAINQGGQGGNARIQWTQRGTDFDIRLSAPITGQGWRLRQQGASASLEGMDGGARVGSDPEALLKEATGWEIPLEEMTSWVRGARSAGQGELQFGPGGLPATLSQDGWTVEFRDWTTGSLPLPDKIFARRSDASVRLVIERWGP